MINLLWSLNIKLLRAKSRADSSALYMEAPSESLSFSFVFLCMAAHPTLSPFLDTTVCMGE